MSKTLYWLLALALCGAPLMGCDDGEDDTADMGAEGEGEGESFENAAAIEGYLEGKTLVMTGDDIPTDPNGFNENADLGPNTQCYNRVELTFGGGAFSLNTTLGTLEGDMCNRDAANGDLMFATTAHIVNGNGECFDIDLTFAGFGQEGRGMITADTLSLELFFMGQAANHRCADGAVGSGGIVLNGNPFEGDAVQVFRIPQE